MADAMESSENVDIDVCEIKPDVPALDVEDDDPEDAKPSVLGVYPKSVMPFFRTLICAEAQNAVNTITAT
jgi:hypothetical protein